MNPIEAILNLGSIAGLITIFLEVHQSRRNRPSLAFTQEGYATVNFQTDKHPHRCDAHFQGLIRNASLQPNTIVRLHLVMWEDNKLHHAKRHGYGEKSIKNLATEKPLELPLRLESRDGIRAEIDFDLRLTDSAGTLTHDGEVLTMPMGSRRPNHELVFEDAAGNYFDRAGRLLNRELIDLYITRTNYKGWKRTRWYRKVAWAWIRWKLAITRSWFGFYR
jgi:hypothetical protein